MGLDLPDVAQAALVARLRAAGCVFAEDEAALLIAAADSAATLDELSARRVSGEPLEQVLGWAEFCGLRLAVVPGVFVPRRRTEFLATEAIARVRPGSTVLDLCCGCGAIGLAIRAVVAGIDLHAAELDPVAASCAQQNLGSATPVYVGDLFAPIPPGLQGRFDLIVANVPYVPSDEVALMPPEARIHEPLVALDGGDDGLTILRRVAIAAPDWLAPGGVLLIETSERQAAAAIAALTDAGLAALVGRQPDLEAAVVVGLAMET